MSSTATFADFVNHYHPTAEQIANLCVDLVRSWAGELGVEEIYAKMLADAKDAGAIDRTLYQLEGDREYAENVALLVLSSAWNYPELAAAMHILVESGAADSAGSSLDRNLAIADLYGMFLLARDGAKVKEVAYRAEDGSIKTKVMDSNLPAAKLFEAVAEMYAAML